MNTFRALVLIVSCLASLATASARGSFPALSGSEAPAPCASSCCADKAACPCLSESPKTPPVQPVNSAPAPAHRDPLPPPVCSDLVPERSAAASSVAPAFSRENTAPAPQPIAGIRSCAARCCFVI